MRIHLLVAGSLLGALASAGAALRPADRLPSRHVDGELLVKFSGGPRGPAAENARRIMRHEKQRDFDQIGWQQIRLPRGLSVQDALARYRNLPGVLAAEPNGVSTNSRALSMNFPRRALSAAPAGERVVPSRRAGPGEVEPQRFMGSMRAAWERQDLSPALADDQGGEGASIANDPLFAQQYGLAAIAAQSAWAFTTGGPDVVIAVLDSGVTYNHEDLAPNMWQNPGEIPGNGVDDDGNGYVDDVYGIDTTGNDSDPRDEGQNGNYHGTACAGIIGAVGNNGKGVAGINWSAQIMAVRMSGTSPGLVDADMLEALNYVVLMKRRGINIRVVSMSWGDNRFRQAAKDAHDVISNEGILQVVAVDNGGVDQDISVNSYPDNYQVPTILTVTSANQADGLSTGANWGRTNVDLAAPGVGITTVLGPATNLYGSGFTGTSFACPHVSGAAALLFSLNPLASALDVKSALIETVDVLPAFTNKTVSNGRLNVGRAVLHPLIAVGAPRFASHPKGQSVMLGSNAALSVSVGGTHPLSYQWYFNEAVLSGVTNSTFNLDSVAFKDAGPYSVVVTNTFGAVTSQVAVLAVVPLVVTTQPRSQAVRFTSNVTFSVTVASPAPVTYQWQFQGVDIPNATAASLLITNVQISHQGDYAVRVVNSFGSAVSSDAALVVLVNPLITVAPVSQSVVAGGNVTFSVGFSGNPTPFGVRWLQLSSTRASNTVSRLYDFFTLSNAQPAMAGQWRVIVKNQANTNSAGESRTFSLAVLADNDADGLPDAWEAAYFGATNALADTDGDGMTNLEEYQAGTNPQDVQSVLKIDSLTFSNGATSASLRFAASSNKTYTVQSRDAAAAAAWAPVADVLAKDTNRVVEVTDPGATNRAQRFYRVRLN